MTTITVLVGQRAHPVSGRRVRVPGDAVAVSLALQLVDPASVRLISAGELDDAVARDYLALGARRIEVLALRAGEDVVQALARAVEERDRFRRDLLLTGLRSEGALGSGCLPYALAQRLGCPVLRDIVAVQAEGADWQLTQTLPKGARRQWRLSCPAVLAIHPSAAVTPRHAFANQLQGQVVSRLPSSGAGSLASERVPASDLAWQRVPSARRLAVLDAPRALSGHGRMLGAIGGDSAQGKAQVLSTGSAREKAQALFRYLHDHALLP